MGKREITSVTLPPDLRKWLKDKADAAYRSFTMEVVMRLEESRKQEEAKHAESARA